MKKLFLILFSLSFFVGIAAAQDVIVLKNAVQIKAKVKVVGDSEISYLKWENLNGPLYNVKKSEVEFIQYQNGTKESFARPVKSQGGFSYNNEDKTTDSGTESSALASSMFNPVPENSSPSTPTKTSKKGKDDKDALKRAFLYDETPSNRLSSKRSGNSSGSDYVSGDFKFISYAYLDVVAMQEGELLVGPEAQFGFSKNNFNVGLLVGYLYVPEAEGYFIPAGIDVKYYFNKKKFSPFVDLRASADIGKEVVFDGRAGLGFDAGAFSMSLGYANIMGYSGLYAKLGVRIGRR